MFRFKKFQVYKDSKEFVKFCENVISKTKINHNKDLTVQIRRAMLSVILNIAEGSGCDTDKEFSRFLEISLRSVYEIVAAFDFAYDINLISELSFKEIENKAEQICKQLNGFRRSLKNKNVQL
ncbi:MAG: hypothetical protein A2539_02280 [Elusimicrobia bacterium RIFOXYD2_FULL_34_15]|nr:MAG: hypothetical protein A2539_02280 [Elusimicrobia bacterium RIFOXYD2_FULL_34_15]